MIEILNFPVVPVSKQLFHVPGGAIDGGFTVGGARILSPEPGGRAMLEMQIALQVREWDYPTASWLMSQGNGQIFRIRLAPTPQILSARKAFPLWDGDVPWSNHQPWDSDITAVFVAGALEGSTIVYVNMTGYGDIARPGHVIGHGDNSYLIDKIEYNNDDNVAKMTVKPPLRNEIHYGDFALYRSFFLGTINNIEEVRTTYDAEGNGTIQPGRFIFAEAIV